MKLHELEREIIERKGTRSVGTFDRAPYVQMVEMAQNKGGGKIELEEGDNARQIKRRLRLVATELVTNKRLKFDDKAPEGFIWFVFKEPQKPRGRAVAAQRAAEASTNDSTATATEAPANAPRRQREAVPA